MNFYPVTTGTIRMATNSIILNVQQYFRKSISGQLIIYSQSLQKNELCFLDSKPDYSHYQPYRTNTILFALLSPLTVSSIQQIEQTC